MSKEPAEVLVPIGTLKAVGWFFENSLDTFVTIEGETIHNVNATWKALTGWSRSRARGQTYWSFVHPEDMARAREIVAGLAEGDRTVHEHRLKTAAGDWVWVRSHVVRGEEGWTLVIVRDISAERQREQDTEAVREASQAKSLFLANMSHEIRTPMNGVLGVLHLLKAESSAAARERLIDEALAAGANLSSLLNDIIDYADLQSGKVVLAREGIDPGEQLEMVVGLLRRCAEEKGLTLDIRVEPDVGRLRADPGRLRQMYLHLIGNAVKFTGQGRVDVRMSVSGQGEGQRLRLDVSDTGPGIPYDAQARLFERFSQGDNSSTRRFGGGGLGLTITRHLAELMGGVIGFRSEPGVGSTFWVEIPAPAQAEARAEPVGGGWLEGVRVLVVEDNPTNRLVATGILSHLGAEVETAENGAEGVAAVEAGEFDLIFMDIQMPVMDGMEATRRIRAMSSPKGDVPILALTANVMPAQLADYRDCGVNGVVAKPISPATLLAEVARIANDEPEADDVVEVA